MRFSRAMSARANKNKKMKKKTELNMSVDTSAPASLQLSVQACAALCYGLCTRLDALVCVVGRIQLGMVWQIRALSFMSR